MKPKSVFILSVFAWLMACHVMASEPRSSESESDKARRLALQAKYEDMPEVELNRVKADVKFQIVDMRKSLIEVNGAKYCAFRFKTDKKVSQLTWCFRLPPGLREWYILPEKGRMEGFFDFRKNSISDDDDSMGSKGDFVAYQSLPGRFFEPDTGYIIWFEIRDSADSAVNLSLNMTDVPDGAPYSAVFETY